MKRFKKFLLSLGIVLGVLLLCGVGLFTWLILREYRPAAVELLPVETVGGTALEATEFTVLSWNIGYCGLGAESDFFMDGGSMVRPASEAVVAQHLEGIRKRLLELNPDFILLQEVDTDSKRSYGVDEATSLREALGRNSAFALNFSCDYVPYPLPPIGKVHSGLLSFSVCGIRQAERISLPCPFSWPISAANLKRCLLVSRIPVAGTERELVLVNLHLEAYDDGAGKLAQSRQLREFMEQEYAKGNYVIAGGDWNQIFPDTEARWENTHPELWLPGILDPSELAEGWRYVWDASVPSCRLLNQAYDPEDKENTQYYGIDGFLVSPNLNVLSVRTLEEGFANSDHNPVLLGVTIGD